MRVAFVSAEASPWAKTGGLGDVVGALPAALRSVQPDLEVCVFLPLYREARERLAGRGIDLEPLEGEVGTTLFGHAERGRVLAWVDADGVRWAFVDHPGFYDRPRLYDDARGAFFDNAARFAFLCEAAIAAGPGALGGAVDLFHCHDWHAGALPLYLRARAASAPATPTVMTIHNLGYQGVFDKEAVPALGLPWSQFTLDVAEQFDRLNLLKGGVACADATTTVSPGYAREMLTPADGHGLDGFLAQHARRFRGILNGLAPGQRSPGTDPCLSATFDLDDLSGKAACRAALLAEHGLTAGADEPVFGVVSRFAHQKGLDLVADVVPGLTALGARLVVLGSGDAALEQRYRDLAARFPDHLAVRTTFDRELAQRIFGGADAFLVPSRFEPCGLTQLQAMAYGAVPVVRAVGGLRDTVLDPREAGPVATGFTFGAFRPDALLGALGRAVDTFRGDREGWRRLQRNGMARDATWETSARRYLELYAEVLAGD